MLQQNQDKIQEVQEDLQQSIQVSDYYITEEIKKENPYNDIHNMILKSMHFSYKRNQKQKSYLKSKFFSVVMSFYALIILTSILAIFLIPAYCSNSYIAISAILGAIVSLVTTVLKIPKIIAEYLFPKDEDNIMLDMSKHVLLHDEILKKNEKPSIDENNKTK